MNLTKTEVMQRLHAMVDEFATVPDEWFDEGILPLSKVTFLPTDGSQRMIVFVVGVTDCAEEG